jgi:serine phosphatase RsbU (regulator of sigma subunit)
MLKPGSVALIVSDGVVSGGDEWLRSLLAASEGADMKALARETLRRAASEYGCSDDMTVLAVRVDARP